jgi:cytochrome P450
MPFGVGPRVCIAAQFALAEITVVVARVLKEVVLMPAEPKPHVSLQVTTRSTTGLNVVAQRRRV